MQGMHALITAKQMLGRSRYMFSHVQASPAIAKQVNHAGLVKRGGTAARKHARDAIDNTGLISNKHRDDMLLDALIQRLGPVDVDIIDFFGAPELHEPCLHLRVHVEH